MSAKYKSPSFLLPNELNTSANTANNTGINSLYSMDFNSSNSDYIDIGTIDSLNAQQNFSISLWFKENVRKTYGFMFSSGTGTSNDIAINAGNGTLKINVGGVRNVNITSYSSNVWYHVVLTVENTTAKVYLNNGSPTTVTVGSNTSSSSGNLAKIGDLSFASGYYFDGKIDEVAIFNRALNTTEIAALYGGTSPNIYPSNLIASNLNPIAYYPLGEQAQMQGYLGNEVSSEWQFPNGVLQDYVMDFDSTSPGDHVSLGDLTTVESNEFTISMWVNKDNITTNSVLFNSGTAPGPNNSVTFQHAGSTFYIGVGGAGASTLPAGLSSGVWYNFILTVNGTTAKLYIDGSQFGSNITIGSVRTGIGSEAVLGKYKFGTFANLDGKMSNVVIWNTDQSTNIANIYNNGSPQTTYTVTPQNWWKLNATSVYTPSAPNYTTALDFDNSPTGQGVIYSPTSLPSTSSWSVSFWAVSAGSTKQWLWDGVGAGIHIDNVYIRFTGAVGGDITMGTIPFSKGDLFHMLASYDGSTLKVYIDGSEFYSGSVTTNISTDYITIGGWNRYGYPTGNVYYGYSQTDIMSNFAVWDSALTASQVSTIFNFGTPETNISFSPRNYYKLDNTTTGLNDLGSGGANASISGTGITQVNTSVAVVPSWKIPSALTIPTINYTTAGSFNGTSSKIATTEENLGTTNTISFWHKRPTGMGSNKVVIGGNTLNRFDGTIILNGQQLIIGFPTEKALFIGGQIFQAAQNASSVNIPYEDVWVHYCITRNGTTQSDIKLYVNSYLVTASRAEHFGAVDYTTNTTVFNLGAASAQSNFSEGELSNISTFSSAFTQAQVNTLYNNGQPSADISSLSPVNWWKLDTIGATITDNGSAGNNGTNTDVTAATTDVKTSDLNIPVNGVSTTLPSTALQQSDLQFDSPYSNYSLSFDGTNSINCGTSLNSSLNGFSNSFSVSLWVKVTNTSTRRGIIGNYTQSSGIGFYIDILRVNDTTFTLQSGYHSSSSTYMLRPSSSQFTTNNWYHLSMTVDSGGSNNSVNIYVDGVLNNGTSQFSQPISYTNTNNLKIANIAYGGDEIIGKIDETSIFNYSLSEAQILEIYNNGKPGNLSNYSGTAPISWWRLGENAYFDNNSFIVPNSISGAPNGTGSGTVNTMISADAPGTYANGIGTNLDILDRVGDAPLSTSNSQSYNIIPSDISPYVPGYVGKQIANNFSMSFDSASNTYFNLGRPTALNFIPNTDSFTISAWVKPDASALAGTIYSFGAGNTTQIKFVVTSNGSGNKLEANIGGSITLSSTSITSAWTHVVCVVDNSLSSGKVKIYRNGINDTASGGLTGSATNTTANGAIGARFNTDNTTPGYLFTGEIDEVAIFDTALSAGQIYNDIYQPTATGTNQTADFVNNPNLPNPVAWYRMGD